MTSSASTSVDMQASFAVVRSALAQILLADIAVHSGQDAGFVICAA